MTPSGANHKKLWPLAKNTTKNGHTLVCPFKSFSCPQSRECQQRMPNLRLIEESLDATLRCLFKFLVEDSELRNF